MSTPPPQTYANSSGLRKWIIGCFFVCPLVCCLGTVLVGRRWVDIFDQSGQLESLVAVAKKRHFPFEAKELARVPALTKSQNAKESLLALAKKYGPKSGFRKELGAYDSLAGKPLPKVISDYVEEAKKVAQFPSFDSEKDLDMGSHFQYPEYVDYKDMNKAFGFSAEFRASHGQPAEALKDLRRMRQLVGHVSSETSEIGALVNLAMGQIYCRSCVRVAESSEANLPFLLELKAEVSKPIPEVPLKTALRSGFYVFLSLSRNDKLFRKLRDDGDEDSFDTSQLQRSGLPKSTLWRGQLASYIEHAVAIDIILDSESNHARASRKIKAYVDKVPSTTSSIVPLISLSSISDEALAYERKKMAQVIAIRFIDLLIERKGRDFPEKIAPVADTYTDGKLVYLRTKKGFKLYSIGKNGKDEGGPKNKIDRKTSDDFGYEYPVAQK